MSALVGVGSLVRLVLRRDRVRLPIWVLALFAITFLSAAAVADTYDTQLKIDSYAENVGGSPASIALAGPPIALTTIQGIVVYETSLTLLLGVALMTTFTVVRHTRTEEEHGRTELLAAGVVGRHAGTAAAVLVASAAAVLVGAAVTVSVLPQGFSGESALLYGAAVGALGIVFAGVAAAVAQLVGHGRTAVGATLALLGVVFALRAVGDVRESALTWFSPIGWSQQVRVSEANRWWPLLLSVVLAGLLVVLAGFLTTRRDLGTGLFAARPGPARAGRALSGPLGLAWRLQRGAVLGWAAGLAAFGLMFGSLSRELQNMVEDNPTLAEFLAVTGGDITDAFFATSLSLMGILAAGFAVSSALRLHGEEGAGRLEPVLATTASRTRVLLAPLVVTVGGVLVLLTAGGLGLGIADAVVTGDGSSVLRLTALSWLQVPAVLVLAALAVLLTGWLPRAVVVAWAALGFCFVLAWLGGLLDPPGWVSALSPFDHLPFAPVDPVRAAPLLWLSLVAGGLGALGLVGFRRRDIG